MSFDTINNEQSMATLNEKRTELNFFSSDFQRPIVVGLGCESPQQNLDAGPSLRNGVGIEKFEPSSFGKNWLVPPVV